MFKTGDLVVYSVHGLCKIDDICERTIKGETKNYYVLHPINDSDLKISIPVDSKKAVILETLNKEEAEEIMKSFVQPGIKWVDDVRKRQKKYSSIVKSGDRKEIANIANTLMRKQNEAADQNKKLYDQDRKLLTSIQEILFKELAAALDKTVDDVLQRVNQMISHQA